MSKANVPPHVPVLKLIEPGNGILAIFAAPERRELTRCEVCGDSLKRRRRIVLTCERCGVPFHDNCNMTLVASGEERRILTETDEVYHFFCLGCRS